MRVTDGIPLGSSLLLPVDTANCVQTLKAINVAREVNTTRATMIPNPNSNPNHNSNPNWKIDTIDIGGGLAVTFGGKPQSPTFAEYATALRKNVRCIPWCFYSSPWCSYAIPWCFYSIPWCFYAIPWCFYAMGYIYPPFESNRFVLFCWCFSLVEVSPSP
jgi:hypothetical protein